MRESLCTTTTLKSIHLILELLTHEVVLRRALVQNGSLARFLQQTADKNLVQDVVCLVGNKSREKCNRGMEKEMHEIWLLANKCACCLASAANLVKIKDDIKFAYLRENGEHQCNNWQANTFPIRYVTIETAF